MLDPGSAASWVNYADRNYTASRLLWFSGLQMDAPVLAHRSLELYLKAFLVGEGEEIASSGDAWGHWIEKLGRVCEPYSPDFALDAVRLRLAYFDRYFEYVRYPTGIDASNDDKRNWKSYEAAIEPLDELTAFIRPRVKLTASQWQKSELAATLASSSPTASRRKRALTESNRWISAINCHQTATPTVKFSGFSGHNFPGR